ncbi:MAG: hypothetical protein IT539_09185 [Bradyrhizobiaceae bacterium]|nr:hypothetical protein [Bradyrhizobiaceae bacterium]
MTGEINWKPDVNWDVQVAKVITYFAANPKLKFGPRRLDKALPIISDLCRRSNPVTRSDLMKSRELDSFDDILTILSNVTMALQGVGTDKVRSLEDGGWYIAVGSDHERAYVISPGFAESWRKFRLA